ncbi:methyl-accepting chemotaxis protein [Microvirga terricola]|uniref:HAMP domain-containing protein n=1 Tax=Microvirga terricola TaxID=2719797 RepID=A0ABX0VGJ5_9HYPH|nr:methyl-accepting chemotaxis protein [Microvirga terricola]NIX77895.1 HAMP domain-containing protein [Microvirga terricola]
MSFLSRFRILPKILMIVVFLSLIAVALSALGVRSLSSLNDATDAMERASNGALAATRISVNILSMNSGEFRLSGDPRPETIDAVRAQIAKDTFEFDSRLNSLHQNVETEDQDALHEIERLAAAYRTELDSTLVAANAVKNYEASDEMRRLREETLGSLAAATKLRVAVRTLSEKLDHRLQAVSDNATAEYLQASKHLMVVAGIGVAVGLAFGFLLGQFGIARPIRSAVAVLQRLANGDFSSAITGANRKDEVGDVARAALVFRENGLEKIRLEKEQEAAKARSEAEKQAAMHQLAEGFEKAVGAVVMAVSSAATQLQGSAHSMTAAAEETSVQSLAVASASEEASTNVQTVAAAAEELSISVQEIARQVADSARIATAAVTDADATAEKVQRLSHAASRIGDVVNLISSIASQTNLLALNATIEAARAGEAGKGFAVVAQEVKVLAEQTAKATSEIATQIQEIQASTAESANAIQNVTNVIRTIHQTSTAIAAAVEQQGAATQEIARNVQQASQGTAEVSSNITGVTRAAEESSAASAQVLTSASDLSEQSELLRSQVGQFLANVRAA